MSGAAPLPGLELPDDPPTPAPRGEGRVVRVLPDVPAVDRPFDYLLPPRMDSGVRVGTMVRVPFHHRRVAGWVMEVDVEPPEGVALLEVTKVVGEGPGPSVVDFCRWAAWRWAGRLTVMLRLASPDHVVKKSPPVRVRPAPTDRADELAAELLAQGPGTRVLQVSPTADPLGIALAAASTGQALVVVPGVVAGGTLARRLRRAGANVAEWPDGWAAAAGGATVVGGRAAVFAPLPELSAVVVLDEHEETLQSEQTPSWHAREAAVERARRAGVPCLLVSPCPTVDALAAAGGGVPVPPVRGGRAFERSGWALLKVVDRRGEDTGRAGLFSEAFVAAARSALEADERVVVVLNRTGRARLLACRSCGALATCDTCDSVVRSETAGTLECSRCHSVRPAVCRDCGSTALSLLKLGVDRAAEELEALLRRPVTTLTGKAAGRGAGDRAEPGQVVIGTVAALHQVPAAGLVAFADLDGDLFVPAYRAAESALAMLVRASRLVGGRARGGAVLIQTRHPEHEVVVAALGADPSVVSDAEWRRRELLGFPPAATIAVVGRAGAPEFVERLGQPMGVQVQGPDDGQWLLRADHQSDLLDALASADRPAADLRLWVDPLRVR